jgi:Tfp pilus assembly protein PilO
MIGVLFAITIQLCVFVWGAAMMSSGMAELRTAVAEVKVVGQSLSQQMVSQAVELAGLKATVQAMKEQGR